MFKTYETELAGRKLVFETGKMAGLANGSVLVRYGDTVVLVNVTASKEPREGIDFVTDLTHLFPERTLKQGKSSLKNARLKDLSLTLPPRT